jgi:L-threonylcarbamoyladenylate synthase
MLKGVFLDRDGTIIEDRGHLRDRSQVVFLPEAFGALRRLQEEFLLFIVTNQSGIAEKAITRQDADSVNAHVVARLADAGIRVTDVYVCPHSRQDGCSCIKPHPHFLRQAAMQYRLDLRRSFAVGDHPHDVELARVVGAQGVYVLTGHGERHLAELPSDASVARDIGQAAERILTISMFQTETRTASENLRQAARVLRNGGIVAFPTETVYGLGANAFDATAVARIFEIKRRPRFDPLIVHACSVAQARRVVRAWPDAAMELARRFWPGPLTLVLPKSDEVPDIVTSGLPTVALRMPGHPLALAMIAEAGLPVAAPSANRFGGISPTRVEHVRKQLGEDVDTVLEGGPCRVGIESTIVSLTDDVPVLLRAGGTPVEHIESVLGPVRRQSAAPGHPTSPGQCPRHYAPRTPLILCEDSDDLPVLPRAGLLTLLPRKAAGRFEAVEVLAANGNLQEAAANLFAALHRLDAMDLDFIVATRMPDVGLGLAMNDRLQRAAQKTTEMTTQGQST